MNSGQNRGKLFLAIGAILIVIIIVVTAFQNKDPKTTEKGPTLFQGIRNLTQDTVGGITEYLGEQTRGFIPLEIKDLENNAQGIPNVIKLSTVSTVGLSIPEKENLTISPDVPSTYPYPLLISQSSGSVRRVVFANGRPSESLFAQADTPELFAATFGNNNLSIVAKSRTLTTLSHHLGTLTPNTRNYCPYNIETNKKNTYSEDELGQIYGLLQINNVIPSNFPPFTDYEKETKSIIQAYQIEENLSKKPNGNLDETTISTLRTTCSEITKEERRTAGETIPEYVLTYQNLASAVEDMIPSKTDTSGALLLNVNGSVSMGILSDISDPKTYTQIFNSPFTDFNLEYPNNETLIATTRPADGFTGVSYAFDTKTKARTTLLEEYTSLMTLMSPDGKFTLYLDSDAGNLELLLLNNESMASSRIPFVTIPDKCVWGNTSLFIVCGVPVDTITSVESWLRGQSTNDEMKAYSLVYNQAIDLPQPNEEVDVYQPIISENDHYFGFIDRKNLHPWMVSLIDFVK